MSPRLPATSVISVMALAGSHTELSGGLLRIGSGQRRQDCGRFGSASQSPMRGLRRGQRPLHRVGCHFRPIVGGDHVGLATPWDQIIQFAGHSRTRQGTIHHGGQGFACAIIDDAQNPEPLVDRPEPRPSENIQPGGPIKGCSSLGKDYQHPDGMISGGTVRLQHSPPLLKSEQCQQPIICGTFSAYG
jgi:hypothetical protein